MNDLFQYPSIESQYQDVRSASRARNRAKKHSANYYGYRGVDPAWIGQPYYSTDSPEHGRADHPISPAIAKLPASAPPVWVDGDHFWQLTEATCVRIWTKKDMYHENGINIWPLDIRHHQARWKRDGRNRKHQLRSMGRSTKQRQGLLHNWQSEHRTGCCEGLEVPTHWIWHDERDLAPTAPPSPELRGSCVWQDQRADTASIVQPSPVLQEPTSLSTDIDVTWDSDDFEHIPDLDFDMVSSRSGSTDWDLVTDVDT